VSSLAPPLISAFLFSERFDQRDLHLGVTHRTLTMRLMNKWPIEKALTTPLQSRRINL
jgi:hypothetical protein